MDFLINNYGYHHITKKIFLLLDHETSITCRSICHSWKTIVDDPYYWINRCKSEGQPISLTNQWIDIVQELDENSPIEQKFVQCLIKWNLKYCLWAHLELDGFLPLHVASRYGCLQVVEYIALCTENVNPLWMPNGCTPIHLAAANGHTNVVKFLASKVNNPNIVDDYGCTPLYYAAYAGKSKVVKFLASKVDDPNYFTDPYEIAAKEQEFEVMEILNSYINQWPDNFGLIVMELPISLIMKCIWTNWKKSTAKQFLKSPYFKTLLTLLFFLCLIFYEILDFAHSSLRLSNEFPYDYSGKCNHSFIAFYFNLHFNCDLNKPANCILAYFLVFIHSCFEKIFNIDRIKNCERVSPFLQLQKYFNLLAYALPLMIIFLLKVQGLGNIDVDFVHRWVFII